MEYSRLILIRGLPGSGKSTLAKLVCMYLNTFTNVDAYDMEADQFFIDRTGQYNFDASKLGEAHADCLDRVKTCLENGDTAIVSNTFTTRKELQPYLDVAAKLKIKPQIITCQGDFGSIHNVPEHTLQKMKDRFQYDI